MRKGRSSARPEPRAPQDPSILSCGDAVRERSARAARRADESLDRGGPVWVRDRSPTHRERARPDPGIEQETDGRWIAEIAQIPGAMAYGSTREETVARVEALALRVLAERIEQGELSAEIAQVFSVVTA